MRFSKRQSFKKLPSSQPVSCPSFSVENHSLAKLSSQEKEQFLNWLQVIILLEYMHIYSYIYRNLYIYKYINEYFGFFPKYIQKCIWLSSGARLPTLKSQSIIF